MANFGGTVKLLGESEYTQALKRCTQNLQSMSSALKSQTADFSANDKSMKSTAAIQKELNNTIKTQQAELSKAKNTYAQYAVAVQGQTTRHNQLNKEYKNAVVELDRIRKASGENSTEYKKQAEVVDKLGKELADSSTELDENKRAMSQLKSEINNANKVIDNAQKEIDDLGKEAKETGKEVESAGDGFTIFKGILADLGSKAIQSAISGLKKLGGAVVSVGKQAVESYAEYEQLVGGVETLFKDSAKVVQDYAAKAYQTAGLSANQYMETVTSFSASLLQGLKGNTEKAAKYADMAIIDMSDNANKMGTSMEMIQNAYQGFAKQNYTMLDNLKLGYGGTKSEMARLVKESGVLGKAGKDLTAKNLDQKVSYDKIIEAIHKVQQRMGITGTTSKEAASTIQGSVNSMKASWQNLLTAIADDNKDLGKSVDEFVNSAVTAAKNLVPRIKVSIDGIKKLISSIVTEVFPKLKKEIPELRPLIETFEWFIKNKELVANAVKIMVAAFAVQKILPFTQTLSDMTKSFINVAKEMALTTTAAYANAAATTTNAAAQAGLTVAQTAGTLATKGLTAATNLLNTAWKSNPIGLIVTGVTAAITLFSVFKGKTEELTEAEKKQKEALEQQTETINNNKKSWEDLKNAKQNSINAGMTEISHYEALYAELQGIVDQNGKVKKGYEQRASFIVDTLSNALGIEIDKNKSLNGQLKDLTTNIDKVIEKKKAQIILDSQESLYQEAITKQAEALKTLDDTEAQLSSKREERTALEEQLAQKREERANSHSRNERWRLTGEIGVIEQKMKAIDDETTNLQTNYDNQKDLLSEYAYNIALYEGNMAKAHEGNYDEMSTVTWDYVKEYQKAGDAEKAQIEAQVKTTETNLKLLKELKDKSGSDIYDSQIKAAEKQLKEHKEALKKYESATETGLGEVEKDWNKSLSNQLSSITGKKVEFKKGSDGNIQAYVDGVALGKPKSEKEMKSLVENTIKEINKKDKDAKTAGENLIDGVNNGVKNQNKQSGVFSSIASFGSKLLGKLKDSLKEHSPSKATKEMGQYLLEGLGIGIENEENSLLNQVSGVGKNVLSALQGELSQNIRLGTMQTQIDSSSINTPAENNYNNTVVAFKEALSEMKIELDDENVGKFVENTVARAIYS